MTTLACRHRGKLVAPGTHRCESPKMIGLKLVTESMCGVCHYRDHAPAPPSPDQPARLHPCLRLGREIGLEEPANGIRLGLPVFECHHPGHPRTTDSQCRQCPDYLFPVVAPETPTDVMRQMIECPPRPQPHGWWNWPNVQAAHADAADDFLQSLPAYPENRYRGRGIVILGGGRYFPSVYVTVRAIRHAGCALPVRVCSFGKAGEMPEVYRKQLEPFDVTLVDLDDPTTGFAFPPGTEPADPSERGWVAKARAILESPFEEVLFLDADCYPCRNPEFLFDDPGYRETGAIFWHDDPFDPRLRWEAFRVTPTGGSSIEAGQLVVNKRECWDALNLGWWYASRHAVTFRWGYGDKHVCFEVPWAKLGRKFTAFSDRGPWKDHAFLHVGPDGLPLFIHRCRDKFRFPGDGNWMSPQNFESNLFARDFPLEAEAFRWAAELARSLGVNRDILNLGCGNRPLLGGHNHDRRPHGPFVDTVHDLNQTPWPWADETFSRIVADDVLQQLDDVTAFMDEAHRILRPGGRLRIRVPHHLSENAVIDPANRRGFHPKSLKFYTREGHGRHATHTERRWKIREQREEQVPNGLNLIWEMDPLPAAE